MSDEEKDYNLIMSSFEEITGAAHVSPLDEQSFEMHELFVSLNRAGFKERQALLLVAYLLSESQEMTYYEISPEDEDDFYADTAEPTEEDQEEEED